MAKYKESKVMVNGGIIKNDYTKHANVPDHVIVKDLDMGGMADMPMYDDTMEGMDKQFTKMRSGVASNRPKSRY
jgi:hypothetical protein